jgi:hypothetical protein
MLRLNFRTVKGDSPTLMLASSVRFCADGTLRGSDNYVVARCVEGCWQVGGRLHRELDCEGPVRVRVTNGFNEPAVHFGPFAPRAACSTATTPVSTFSCRDEPRPARQDTN